ncbi:MAG: hypothetical protein HOJ89_14575 [Opitutales bacterium]|nr:hypothetical protein [Opitutales bacterium]
MSDYFNSFDLIPITAYLLILSPVGIYLKRKASGNLEENIVGRKKMPLWALWTSATTQFLDLSGTAVVVSISI